MKILVTGFEPFGGETMNPALEAVRRLPEEIEGNTILTLQVPVVFNKGAKLILKAIQEEKPDAVLMIGQAGGRRMVTPELQAQNCQNGRIPDNEGNQPLNKKIRETGEDLLFTSLPYQRILQALREEGIPAGLSYSAGQYVCNDVFYHVMTYIKENALSLKAGFVHVPFCTEQIKEKKGVFALPMETIAKAVFIAAREIGREPSSLEERSRSMKPTSHVTNRYDHLFSYQEIADTLYGYQKDHPELCRVTVAGVTEEKRDILVLEVTNTLTGKYEDKPAYYVEGNIHAGEITGCMSVMYFLDAIFSNLEDEEIQKILRDYTIYAMPRVSPDGSEYYLTHPEMVRSVNRPYLVGDEVQGLVPCDLDGDGVIRRMRVKSPFGIWKESKEDPRVMTRRRPDETEGVFYHVFSEGIIQDYDGVTIKAAPQKFGNDFNRNYPIGWRPEHEQRGAGNYPLSHPETRANADFLLNHPNVCSVLDMHTMGGQILYTPGFKSAKEADREDIGVYRAVGKMAQEENGFPLINVYDEYMPVGSPACFGGFDDYVHFILGIPAFTIECWDLDKRAGVPVSFPPKPVVPEEEQENQALKYIQWIDKELGGEGVMPWTKFQHPQLGEVEIGGIDYKHVVQNPPPKFLPEECEKHARFMLRQVKTLPRVAFDKIEVKPLGEADPSLGMEEGTKLYKVEAVLMNTGFLATYVFKEGLKLKTLKPLNVKLQGVKILEGKENTEIGHLAGFGGVGGYNSGLGAMSMIMNPCAKKVSYIVAAKAGDTMTMEVTGGRIGKIKKEVTINE